MKALILETQGVSKRFGGLKAVSNVSIQVKQGQIYGLIGPNGAGKSTFLNCISGTYVPEGKVIFKGKDITGFKPHRVCHEGMARTYQIVRSFQQMTVLENVVVGATFGGKQKDDPYKIAKECLDFVDFPLDHGTLARNLNTMQLKRLELARVLATGCELLLLDEMAAGLTPGELVDISALIKNIRDSGKTIIIVEHLMKLIMEVCDYITVLYFGEKLADGTPKEITENEKVIKAYLGENYML